MKFNIKELQELRKAIKPIRKRKRKQTKSSLQSLEYKQPTDHMKGYSTLPPYILPANFQYQTQPYYPLEYQSDYNKQLLQLQDDLNENKKSYNYLTDEGGKYFYDMQKRILQLENGDGYTSNKAKDIGTNVNASDDVYNYDTPTKDLYDVYPKNESIPNFNPSYNPVNETPDEETVQVKKQTKKKASKPIMIDEEDEEEKPKNTFSRAYIREQLKDEYRSLGGDDPTILNSTRKSTIINAIKNLKS
jgi:hypothetical protein